MVTGVRIPVADSRTGGAYFKLERKIGDYATVGVATHLKLGSDGRIAQAGIGLTSVAPRNLKATEAESMLVGNEPSDSLFADAAAAAAAAADPASDVRGPADYKRSVVKAYVQRGLAECMNQIREG
jgi:carbon-monoxide dehydrogenase medium subunit